MLLQTTLEASSIRKAINRLSTFTYQPPKGASDERNYLAARKDAHCHELPANIVVGIVRHYSFFSWLCGWLLFDVIVATTLILI